MLQLTQNRFACSGRGFTIIINAISDFLNTQLPCKTVVPGTVVFFFYFIQYQFRFIFCIYRKSKGEEFTSSVLEKTFAFSLYGFEKINLKIQMNRLQPAKIIILKYRNWI